MEEMVMSNTGLIDEKFWKNRRVLLTGHTGFKGSWLSIWLQNMGAEVRGIALTSPTVPSLFEVARVSDGMEHRIIDIRNFADVMQQMNEFNPEIVIHMAAQPLVRLSYAEPIETYSTNVMGTVHILEAARRSGAVKAIVNVTTDKCYENKEWIWGYREHEPMGGYDPYSSSKGCSELVSSAYRTSYLKDEKISMATARAGNVIGGGDWSVGRLVPDIMRSLEHKEPVEIRNPKSTRPWQHVLEPLSGYLLLAENLHKYGEEFAEAWNFGPEDDDVQPVQWIVKELCGNWGGNATWCSQSGNHPHEASLLKLDISKAKQRLNWRPRWRLDKTLKNITDWHQAWLSGNDMKKKCLDQIRIYENDMRFEIK